MESTTESTLEFTAVPTVDSTIESTVEFTLEPIIKFFVETAFESIVEPTLPHSFPRAFPKLILCTVERWGIGWTLKCWACGTETMGALDIGSLEQSRKSTLHSTTLNV